MTSSFNLMTSRFFVKKRIFTFAQVFITIFEYSVRFYV